MDDARRINAAIADYEARVEAEPKALLIVASRREAIAHNVLLQLLANGSGLPTEVLVRRAVEVADCLIGELAKTKEPKP